jgi:hypothetical protein
LCIFGAPALEAIEALVAQPVSVSTGVLGPNAVGSVLFRYVPFEPLVAALPRLRALPRVRAVTLVTCGVCTLAQLALLRSLPSFVTELSIEDCPLLEHPSLGGVSVALMRSAVAYFLPQLTKFNGTELMPEDGTRGKLLFGAAADAVSANPVVLPASASPARAGAASCVLNTPSAAAMLRAGHTAVECIVAAVDHAAAAELKLSQLNLAWEAALERIIRQAAVDVAAAEESNPDALGRLDAELEEMGGGAW